MILKGLLTMSTKELERLSIIEKTIAKRLTQMIAALFLSSIIKQKGGLILYLAPSS